MKECVNENECLYLDQHVSLSGHDCACCHCSGVWPNIRAHKLGTRSKCVKNASRPPYVHVIGEMIIYTLITLASLFWSRWVFGAQSTLVSNHKPPIIERKNYSTGFWFCVAVECATMSHLRFCAEEEVERSNKQVLLIINHIDFDDIWSGNQPNTSMCHSYIQSYSRMFVSRLVSDHITSLTKRTIMGQETHLSHSFRTHPSYSSFICPLGHFSSSSSSSKNAKNGG